MRAAGIESQRFFGRRLDQKQGFRPKQNASISVSIFQGGSCGLLYLNPMPIPETLAQHYDIAPEGYWAGRDFEVDWAPRIDCFAKSSGLPLRSCTALDIGAGAGNMMRALRRAGFDACSGGQFQHSAGGVPAYV